ncbi:MAG: hypothetical protein WDN50_15795 [Bradyrhizobium sp.]
MSDQQAEPISGESGSLGAGPAASHSTDAPVTAATPEPVGEPAAGSAEVESPKLVPEQGAVAPEVHVSKAAAPEAHSSEPEAVKETADAPRVPGKIMIMSSADHDWAHDDEVSSEPEAEPSQGMFGKRRISALAAVVAFAAMAGALGGALATVGLAHVSSDDVTASGNRAIEASIARIDGDILSLKASLEHTSKLGMSQFNKTSDRLDKVEKAQLEPAAKLAKLSETVDKLRATPAPAPAPVAAAPAAPAASKEVTGSVTPPAAVQASVTPPKVEVGRLPTVEGWILRDVANGGALIEGRQGVYEVYAGDPVPGLGRVDAIRRQDGRWVVVTSKGLIVAR